jgi:hypothetical protein
VSHMVTFTSVEGKKGYHQCEELDEALHFVERLRNSEGITDGQVFRMEEVPIEVKQYYRVEVAGVSPAGHGVSPAGSGAGPAGPGAGPAGPPSSPPAAEPPEAPDEPAPEPLVGVTAPTPEQIVPEGRPSFSIFSKP